MSIFLDTFVQSWHMLVEAAPYIWMGLLAAGALHAWVPQDWVLSQLGGRGTGSVFKAALMGVPLPLCSCGVIPATVGLRKRGAGQGATISFLISTPETSVDSVALTWAMLGPLWAIIRPVASVIVAVATGVVANLFPDDDRVVEESSACSCCQETEEATTRSPGRLTRARRFVFRELLPDIGGWLLLGVLLSGLVLALLPEDFLSNLPGGPAVQMLVALLVGIPLYICAAASTPLAAALLIKGMAPGAALVLLLAGPATNMASALVISRQLGKTGTMVYFGGVALGSLLMGALVQWLLPAWKLGSVGPHGPVFPAWMGEALAILLVAAIVVPWLRNRRGSKPGAALHNGSSAHKSPTLSKRR
jgi:uncharacterized membrane protein YraQ (UPF0718 family)